MVERNGGIDGGIESQNTQNNPKAKIDEFARLFVKDRLDSKNDRNTFIDEVMDNDDMTEGLKSDLKNYLILKSEYSQYLSSEDIDSGKISMSFLKHKVQNAFVRQHALKKQIEQQILSEYIGIKPEEYDAKFSAHIAVMTQTEIERLSNSLDARTQLVRKVYGKQMPERTSVKTFLDRFNLEERVKKKIHTLSPEDQRSLTQTLEHLQSYKIDTIDINDLFAYDIFTLKEKRELLLTFIPYITLAQAKVLGFMTDSEILRMKIQVVKDSFRDTGGLDDAEKVARSLDDTSFFVATKDVLTGNREAKKMMEGISLHPIAKSLTETIEATKEELQKRGPHSFEEFKIALDDKNTKLGKKITGSEGLKDGSVLRLQTKKSSGEVEYVFTKIQGVDLGEKRNSFHLLDAGKGNMYQSGSKAGFTNTYADFINFLDSDTTVMGAEVYHEQDILQGHTGFDYEVLSDELTTKSENEIDRERKTLLAEQKKAKDEYGEDSEEYKDIIEKIKKVELHNQAELKKALDEVDPSGSGFGIGKGVVIEVDKDPIQSQDGGIWCVVDIDETKIYLSSGGEVEELDIQSFYQSFVSKKAKRTASVPDTQTLMQKLLGHDSSSISQKWQGYMVNDKGEIIKDKKETSGETHKPIELLIGDGEDALKVYKVGNEGAVVSQVKVKNTTKNKDKKDEQKITNYSISPKETMPLGLFYDFISKHKLRPKENVTLDPTKGIEHEGRFWSKFFKGYSVLELIGGGKLVLDSVEKYLAEGREDHNTKMALKVFGKLMPDELKGDLKSRMQAAERKRTDEYVDKLKALDSWEATLLIKDWLKNKDVPQHKLEASLLFMYKEYGSLYTKELAEYRGTWTWFKALGGGEPNENNPLWMSLREEASQDPNQSINFTEEYAVFMLVKKQCDERQYKKYGGVLRRSRLHKEIKSMWPEGIQNEIEKGYKDASDTRAVTGINNGAWGEIKGGTYANFVGWVRKAAQRGGLMYDVYECPIGVFMTGAIYNFDQRIIKSMKDIYKGKAPEGSPIPLWDYSGTPKKMDELNLTILHVCKALAKHDDGLKEKGILKGAQALYDKRKQIGEPKMEQERIKEFQAFWKKFGEPVTRAMHMVNGQGGKYAHLDKVVLLEKDNDPVLNKYFHYSQTELTSSFEFNDKDYMDDFGQGISGLNIKKAVKDTFEIGSGGSLRYERIAGYVMKELVNEANRIKNTRFSDKDWKDKDMKRKQMKHLYVEVLSGMYEIASHGRNVGMMFEDTTSVFRPFVKKMGLDGVSALAAFRDANHANIEECADLGPKSENPINLKIEALVEQYLSGQMGEEKSKVEQLVASTQFKTESHLDKKPSNEDTEGDGDEN